MLFVVAKLRRVETLKCWKAEKLKRSWRRDLQEGNSYIALPTPRGMIESAIL
jgi:hypothetical protein